MELSLAIRTGYFGVLSGNVLHNNSPVPVYDVFALPEGNTYPYILISSQTSEQRNLKSSKMYNATVLIDIVTGSTDLMGRAQGEAIAEQVENLINPDDNSDIVIQGYKIGNTWRESDTDLGSKNGSYYIYRKLMRYRHLISKN